MNPLTLLQAIQLISALAEAIPKIIALIEDAHAKGLKLTDLLPIEHQKALLEAQVGIVAAMPKAA